MVKEREDQEAYETRMFSFHRDLREFDKLFKQWIKGDITDKEFTLEAKNLMIALKEMIAGIEPILEPMMKKR